MLKYPINTNGVLCRGEMIMIGWPEKHEYDMITNLRNRISVRDWFLDNRALDLMHNRKWLEFGMDRPKEALLSIRYKKNNIFLGTIGWTDWDLNKSSACFGRLIVDKYKIRQLLYDFPSNYNGVAYDACITLRDYAFNQMNILIGETFVFENNIVALNINKAIGLKHHNSIVSIKPDGTKIVTIKMQLSKNEWLEQKKVD